MREWVRERQGGRERGRKREWKKFAVCEKKNERDLQRARERMKEKDKNALVSHTRVSNIILREEIQKFGIWNKIDFSLSIR